MTLVFPDFPRQEPFASRASLLLVSRMVFLIKNRGSCEIETMIVNVYLPTGKKNLHFSSTDVSSLSTEGARYHDTMTKKGSQAGNHFGDVVVNSTQHVWK